MTTMELLRVIAYVAALLLVGVGVAMPIVAWAKREADAGDVDEGRAFGGDFKE